MALTCRKSSKITGISKEDLEESRDEGTFIVLEDENYPNWKVKITELTPCDPEDSCVSRTLRFKGLIKDNPFFFDGCMIEGSFDILRKEGGVIRIKL